MQVDLAGIELAAGNLDAADIAADSALAADARNRDALLIKGQAAVRRIGKMPSPSAAEWTAARSWYPESEQAGAQLFATPPLLLPEFHRGEAAAVARRRDRPQAGGRACAGR